MISILTKFAPRNTSGGDKSAETNTWGGRNTLPLASPSPAARAEDEEVPGPAVLFLLNDYSVIQYACFLCTFCRATGLSMHAEGTSLSVPLCRSAFRVGHQFPVSYLKRHRISIQTPQHKHIRTLGAFVFTYGRPVWIRSNLRNLKTAVDRCLVVMTGMEIATHGGSSSHPAWLSPPLQCTFNCFLTHERSLVVTIHP